MSSQYLPVLPDELLVEILSWVPVKDLIRFRCVSKSWSSLVFDPTFVKLHLQRSSKNTHILLTFRDKNHERKDCATPCSIHGLLKNPSSTIDVCHQFNRDYFVFGVCNGLVCLRDSYIGDEFEEYWVQFWNPATRVMSRYSPRLRISLRSRSRWNSTLFGFGYNDCSDTYKVVTVIPDVKSQKIEVRVHCLGDTCWRNTLTCPGFPIFAQDGQFVSGTVNWLALPKLSYDYQRQSVTINDLVIFSYDLKNDTYRYLSIPDCLIEVSPFSPVVEVFNGCLCLSHHHRGTHYVVWLMREFGVEKSWTQLLNVSYEHLQIRRFRSYPPIPVILCMSENFEVMLLANYLGREIILYNKRDNRIDHYEDFNHSKYWFLSYDYVESLVLPY